MRLQATMTLFCLAVPLVSEGRDIRPWFDNESEIQLRTTLLYQNYNAIATAKPTKLNYHAHDAFMTFSAAFPLNHYCGELTATAACTHHQRRHWDNFRATGKYQWLDEADGAPFSSVVAIIVGEALSRGLHDISSFHHGHLEGEVDLSFGQRYGMGCHPEDYIYAWWGCLGIGTADQGSAWYRGDAACEYHFDHYQAVRCFVNTLWGAGTKNIPKHYEKKFKGYGNIRHRSVDLGVRYIYNADCWGTLSLQYARRVYAHNFPQDVNLLLFEYCYDYGRQSPYSY